MSGSRASYRGATRYTLLATLFTIHGITTMLRKHTSLIGLLSLTLVALPPARPKPGHLEPLLETVVAARRDVRRTLDLEGTFVPKDARAVRLELKQWKGETTLAEVLPHGSYVNAGDVVARVDGAALQREIAERERALASAERAHAVTLERSAQDALQAAERLQDSALAALQAREDLAAWLNHGQALRLRADELRAQYAEHNLEDQKHELEQLEAMYSLDELVEATEEIVLARSRRDLARSVASQRLAQEREALERPVELARSEQQKRLAVERAEAALRRLERLQALEADVRADSLKNAEHTLQEKRQELASLHSDTEALVLRAQQAGLLLHGSLENQAPERLRPEHKLGSAVQSKVDLFCVAVPGNMDLAFVLGEKTLAEARAGLAAHVIPHLHPKERLLGRLVVENSPLAGGGAEAQFAARIALETTPVGLLPGLHAKLEIVLDVASSALVVPALALQSEGNQDYAWVAAADGSFVKRTVQVERRVGSDVLVAEGIAEGERVLLGAVNP